MAVREQDALDALRRVPYPGFSRDIVSAGAIRNLTVTDGVVRFELDPGPGNESALPAIEQAARAALATLGGVAGVEVARPAGQAAAALRMAAPRSSAAAGALDLGLIPEVRHTIAVASGKGGVGKSTVAVNLAVALARAGSRVGLLDADIYGPSIPLMMGVRERPQLAADKRLIPFERHGVRLMSLGFLVDPDSAVIWRGPMVMKAIEQLLRDVVWGALDVLVVDMPPGTGDAQLTLSQKVRLAGAVIVTTPQDVALADAIKGVAMFRKVDVPILGIVENMSWFRCPHCGERTDVFDHGGGRREALRLGVPFLGEVPLDPAIRSGGDAGEPIAASAPESPQGLAFSAIAAALGAALGNDASDAQLRAPGLFQRVRQAWGGRDEKS